MEFDEIVDGVMNGDTLPKCLSSYVDDGTVESQRYFLARRTMLEMLTDRGFVIPSTEIDVTLENFRSTYGPKPDPEKLRIATSLRSDTHKKMLVVFCGPAMIKVQVIRGIISQIANRETLYGLILVVENKITSQASKSLDLLPFKVEVFQITDLLVNITKHVLKPKHRVLTEKEKQKLLKEYNVEEKQLPRISQNDAVAKYYGLVKGQVVKVTYSGDLTQSHVTYRCVWG